MKKILLSSLMVLALAQVAVAQSGTNSPYSQYGLGVLADQSQGFNRAMGGLSMGLRYANQVNYQNPASYSAIDSLTMIFDVGLSGQVTNFTEGGKKVNANNADFEYVLASFRALPCLGVTVGVLPYSNIGYNYNTGPKPVGNSDITSTETFYGSGGVHQAFAGVGWQVVPSLSVGANFGYLWGTYDKYVSVVSSDSYVNTVTRNYTTNISSYKVDLGVQWQKEVKAGELLTVGAVWGIGHKLGADALAHFNVLDKETGVSTPRDPVPTVTDAFSLPNSFSVGAAWQHGTKWTLGVDYLFQNWGAEKMPEVDDVTGDYVLKDGLLSDRHKVVVGGEWVPNATSRRFYNRIHYRFGASYATPYIKVNGQDGPKEYSLSAGLGIPIINAWNNRSLLNISGQWVRASANDLITENTFRINVGITFNERWFMKWKVK